MADGDDARTNAPNHNARRRRRRATAAQGAPAPRPNAVAEPSAEATLEAEASPAKPRTSKRDPGERALRDLIGGGRSQLGVSGALRARDVNRPTDADLEAAERDTVIVRRNWTPSDGTPPGKR